MPKFRSSTMNIRPMRSLFLLLVMGAAFGLTGGLLATPMAAVTKAILTGSIPTANLQDPEVKSRVDAVVYP
nr:hypothetical protein [Pedobacter miscanthi]